MKKARTAALAASLCCWVGANYAQTTDASITGVVVDPSKAAIPDAKLRVTNESTNARSSVVTGQTGSFYISNLAPGAYRVEVERTGFNTILRPDVILHVKDRMEMNFEMAVGPAAETVTVEGGTSLVNTQDATVGTVIDEHFVSNLPLNGRSFQTLLLLTAGAVATPASYSAQGQFSVNGQRADTNYFTVDGVSSNNGVAAGFGLVQSAGGTMPGLTSLGSTQSLVSVDAMQEFRIDTSTFAPEFGRTPGAQISIVSKSGSNQFHGSLFEYLRNDVLDANNWFGDRDNISKPKERQNDFGGVLGGPIWKNHTFFFASYEGLRLRQPLTATTLVPSNAARALLPASVTPFLNLFPVTNAPDLGNGTAQFVASYSNPGTVNAYNIRIDHTINSKTVLFGRYSNTPSTENQRNLYGAASTVSDETQRLQTATIGLNELLAPHISNELRVNYSHARAGSIAKIDNFGGTTPQSSASLMQTLNYPSGFTPQNSLFALALTSAGASLFEGKNSANLQRQANLVDTATVIIGSHHLKFGVDYRWLAPLSGPRNYAQTIIFSGVLGGPGTMQSGEAQSVSVTAPQTSVVLVKNFSLFAQDTWAVSRRLKLTYGVRWEVNPPFKSEDPNRPFYTVAGYQNPPTMTLAPAGTEMYAITWGNFAPRFGLAYEIGSRSGWETVARGGFGKFFDIGDAYLEGVAGLGWPFTSTASYSNVAVPLAAAQAIPAPISTSYPVTSSLYVTVPNLKLPRTWQYNIALEQSLGAAQNLSLTYVGALGRDMIYNYNIYSASKNFPSGVSVATNEGTSRYDALQVKVQRRFLHSLQALAQYTWSHALDTGSLSNQGNPPTVAGSARADYGNADFDIRQSFSGAAVYQVPSPTVHWAKILFGGWSLNNFLTARTAPPVTPSAATVFVTSYFFTPRPNIVPGVPIYLYGSGYPGGKILNNAPLTAAQIASAGCVGNVAQGAFCSPPTGTQGNMARNSVRGYGAWQDDCSIRRQFIVRENTRLLFIAEFFNLLNHPSFGQPTTSLSSALFGQPTSTLATALQSQFSGFSPLYQIGGPRSIQLALKLTF